MSEVRFYFEILNFFSLLGGLIKTGSFHLLLKKELCIYYIDASKLANWLMVPLFHYLNFKIEKLNFKMRDIKDKNGELIRLRIHRKDLCETQEQIIKSETYKALYHPSWEQGRIKDYINKGLIDEGILNKESVARALFVIQVVYWHMTKSNSKSFFFIEPRAWFNIYKQYALKHGICLVQFSSGIKFFNKSVLHKAIRKHPWLYGLVKNIKYRHHGNKEEGTSIDQKLYVEGRGDVNLDNNGQHSDFFWCLNSKFPRKNILYKHYSDAEKHFLNKNGIYSVCEGVNLWNGFPRKYKKPKVGFLNGAGKEIKTVCSLLSEYDLERYYWSKFFNKHNVKIFLTWFKYSNHHMALADAVKDSGGVSAVWQMAYDGYENSECKTNTDISFCFSNFSCQIEKKLNSQIKYNIAVGYLKDYVAPLLRKEAYDLRNKMQRKGAEKIVFVIDENSIDDERWHTGHDLQRENYSYILQKVLSTSWLGVIFKPKSAKTLRQRLGWADELLTEAEKTGRCYVYEASGRHTTSAPPILAGLSADVCIHGHLCTGTAALECVLGGLPTLLIDREGCPYSKLQELPRGKVVFQSWPEALEAMVEHFKTPNGVPGFGDWSFMLDELDPFRDGLAANRMGTYLHWLRQGFEQGLDREVVMLQAADKYRQQWGEDKVLTIQ